LIFHHFKSKLLLRCAALAGLPLLLLGGCASEDFQSKGLSKSVKSNVDWVRDAFGEPLTQVVKDEPGGPYPAIPNDVRPLPRSAKQQKDMINTLSADKGTAGQIEGALGKSDATRYLSVNGAPPTAQPIALRSESVLLPDGIRDLDSYDPSRLGAWFELARIDFPEGSAELPEAPDDAGVAQLLRQAAQLVRREGTLRVIGYSGSDRVILAGRGPHESNRFLADLRARRVAAQLVAMGAPPRQLLVGAAPENERAKAEQVEIIIDY
jgi:outer membrane protein OmpA-like peptidoglycan-associated protein